MLENLYVEHIEFQLYQFWGVEAARLGVEAARPGVEAARLTGYSRLWVD